MLFLRVGLFGRALGLTGVCRRLLRPAQGRRQADERAARARAVHRVGSAVLVTTAILASGFGAVVISDIPINRLVSLVCVVGLFAAVIGDLVLLPAMLVCFARKRRR